MGITSDHSKSQIKFIQIWIYLALTGISAGVLILSIHIFTPYSYWLDELFSVNASSRGWGDLYRSILSDVHPPLYQIILKCWILFFAADEVSTRMLSWAFSIATLYITYKSSKRHGDIFLICALLAIASNGYFSYYGNEVRAYSMLMFCSTLMLLNMPTEKSQATSNLFLLSCILTSWVHYFGLLIASSTLLYLLIFKTEGTGQRIKVITAGLIMSIWPIHHIVNGSLTSKSGGEFWIESSGPIDTVRFASSAIIPSDIPFSGFIFVTMILGLFLCLWYISTKKESGELASTALGRQALAIWTGLIALVGLIDLHTPMSTGRNFIVTVPFFAVSVAAVVAGLSKIHTRGVMLLMAMLLTLCIALLPKSLEEVSRKAQAPEDWRNAIHLALEQSSGKDIYVVQWGEDITDHYIREFSDTKQTVHTYKIGETQIKGPSVIIFARLSPQLRDSLLVDMKVSGGRRIFPEETSKKDNRVGVYAVH